MQGENASIDDCLEIKNTIRIMLIKFFVSMDNGIYTNDVKHAYASRFADHFINYIDCCGFKISPNGGYSNASKSLNKWKELFDADNPNDAYAKMLNKIGNLQEEINKLKG